MEKHTFKEWFAITRYWSFIVSSMPVLVTAAWLFSRGQAILEGREAPPMPGAKARADLAERQFRLALEAKGEKIACLEARKHLCWYLRGVPYAAYAKGEINKAQTAKDVERCLMLIRTEL